MLNALEENRSQKKKSFKTARSLKTSELKSKRFAKEGDYSSKSSSDGGCGFDESDEEFKKDDVNKLKRLKTKSRFNQRIKAI